MTNRPILRTLALIAVVSVCMAPLAARGETILSNLGNDPGTFSPVAVTTETYWAQQFTVGSLPVELSTITTQLGNLDEGNSADFTLLAQLYCLDSATAFPDLSSYVTSFSFDQSLIPTRDFANIVFTPISAVTLDPTKFYWFLLRGESSDGTGAVDWQFTDDPSTTGPGALTNVGRLDLGQDWIVNDSGPFLIEISGTIVPEPGSWLLGAIGFSTVMAALGLRRRRAS